MVGFNQCYVNGVLVVFGDIVCSGCIVCIIIDNNNMRFVVVCIYYYGCG